MITNKVQIWGSVTLFFQIIFLIISFFGNVSDTHEDEVLGIYNHNSILILLIIFLINILLTALFILISRFKFNYTSLLIYIIGLFSLAEFIRIFPFYGG